MGEIILPALFSLIFNIIFVFVPEYRQKYQENPKFSGYVTAVICIKTFLAFWISTWTIGFINVVGGFFTEISLLSSAFLLFVSYILGNLVGLMALKAQRAIATRVAPNIMPINSSDRAAMGKWFTVECLGLAGAWMVSFTLTLFLSPFLFFLSLIIGILSTYFLQ